MASLLNETAQSRADISVFTPSTPHSTPQTTTESMSTAETVTKKRRIRFSNAWDILLSKAVTAGDAHLSPHGETQNRFEEALSLFKALVPAGCFETVVEPTWKSLNDRFKKTLGDHREAVRKNGAASGIIEVRGERETLLDDLMLAVDEWEETRRVERDERTELDKRFLKAGEDIRARALSKVRISGSSDTGGTNGSGQDNETSNKQNR